MIEKLKIYQVDLNAIRGGYVVTEMRNRLFGSGTWYHTWTYSDSDGSLEQHCKSAD